MSDAPSATSRPPSSRNSSLAPTSYAHVSRRTLTFPPDALFGVEPPPSKFISQIQRRAEPTEEVRHASGTMAKPILPPPPEAISGDPLDLESEQEIDAGWDDPVSRRDRSTSRIPPSLSEAAITQERLSDADATLERRVLDAADAEATLERAPLDASSAEILEVFEAQRPTSDLPDTLPPPAPLPDFGRVALPFDAPPLVSDRPEWETKDTLRPCAIPQVEDEQAVAARRAANADAEMRRDRTRAQLVTALRQRSWIRQALVPIIVSHTVVAVVIGLIARTSRPPVRPFPRDARVALDTRLPLAAPAGIPPELPPEQGCATAGESKLLAARAEVGPGIDMAVLDTGFAVGLAEGPTDALGVRLSGPALRVAETVRVKGKSPLARVTVDPGEEEDALDVKLDSDEARTVVGTPAFKVVARGLSVVAVPEDPKKTRVLWALPGLPRPVAAAPAMRAPARPGTRATYRPAFLGRQDPPRPLFQTEVVRVAGRADGGAVVALRRPAMLMLGMVEPSLAPAGPLVPLVRKGATVGAPAVSPAEGGGAVAWAEKEAGEADFRVFVATWGAAGVTSMRAFGKGISPSLALLPGGDLLLAYADGTSGAHRVVAVRLAKDLEPRDEPLVVSPESMHAGQPVAAVRADGRALVAFFATDRGKSAAVLATPLACDPGR